MSSRFSTDITLAVHISLFKQMIVCWLVQNKRLSANSTDLNQEAKWAVLIVLRLYVDNLCEVKKNGQTKRVMLLSEKPLCQKNGSLPILIQAVPNALARKSIIRHKIHV